MRLIDADALMQALGITNMDCDKCAWHDKEWSRCKRGGDFEDACCAIENAPIIEERKTGEWIDDGTYGDYHPHHSWHCSECEESVIEIDAPWFKFCPNCGADMRGKQNED